MWMEREEEEGDIYDEQDGEEEEEESENEDGEEEGEEENGDGQNDNKDAEMAKLKKDYMNLRHQEQLGSSRGYATGISNVPEFYCQSSGQIIGQDIFSSGAIKSATDFQVYKEVAGLSALDFGYTDNTAVTIQRTSCTVYKSTLQYQSTRETKIGVLTTESIKKHSVAAVLPFNYSGT